MNNHENHQIKHKNAYPSFVELNNVRFKIQGEIAKGNESFNDNEPTAFIDADELDELYDLHTQITAIIGIFHLDELFRSIDRYSHTKHANFIEGLQGVINPTQDYDDAFFVQLDEWDWDYEWNDQFQEIRKKTDSVPYTIKVELLEKLRKQIIRRMDKAIEFWATTEEKLETKLTSSEKIINQMNHFLLLQSFEDYDSSMIFNKQLRKYIKSRPFFPAITADTLHYESLKLGKIAEKKGFKEVLAFLNGFLD